MLYIKNINPTEKLKLWAPVESKKLEKKKAPESALKEINRHNFLNLQ